MRILVFSDSHSYLELMRAWMEAVRPACVIHLGDYVADGRRIAQEYPQTVFYQLPGNCDAYREPVSLPQIQTVCVGGVKLYLTHGHLHHVKFYTEALLADARKAGAAAALYGHTHMAECVRERDGLWVLNPGSCGVGGTVGLMEIEDGTIRACRILDGKELAQWH